MRAEVKWQIPIPRTSGTISRELHFKVRNPQGEVVDTDRRAVDIQDNVTPSYYFEEGSHVHVDLMDVTAGGTYNKAGEDDFIVAKDYELPPAVDGTFARILQKEVSGQNKSSAAPPAMQEKPPEKNSSEKNQK